MLLGDLSATEFLADFWQQKPLLIRNALPAFADPLTAEELAGLAMEDFVESRLVCTDGSSAVCSTRDGPFDRAELQTLGECNWTLLVQAVDQHVEAVARLRELCSFLPQWRLDDVMVSCAAPGGGVGPHFDQYDVFLLQGQGTRLWRIGPACNANTRQFDNGGLHCIAPFTPLAEHTLHSGDVLYLPPGIAHWGIAETQSLSYSLGFRAPSHAEVLAEWSQSVAGDLDNQLRYRDPAPLPAEGGSLIESKSIDCLQQILRRYVDDRDLLARWFGSWVTEPRYPENLPDHTIYSEQQLQVCMRRRKSLRRSLATRMALTELRHGWVLFVDGGAVAVANNSLPLAQLLIAKSTIPADELLRFCGDGDNTSLIMELLSIGSYAFTSE